MSSYKYVTPYWEDSQQVYGAGIKIYSGTTLYILNYNDVRASVSIHFFDRYGKLLPDMEVSMFVTPQSVVDIRILDILARRDHAYRTTTNSKTGSLKIVSDEPLTISGKIYNGKTTSLGTEDLNVWSIPFEEIRLEEVELGKLNPNAPISVSDKSFGNFLSKKPK